MRVRWNRCPGLGALRAASGALLALLLMMWPGLVHAELRVVATLPSLAAIADAVGGEHVRVVSLASPDQDPHYVDPRPNLVLELNKADLLIVNGLELEASWLRPILINARNPDILVGARGYFDGSQAVPRLLQVPTVAIDRSMGDIHPGGNPHYLFDPRASAAVGRALGARMAQLDPANAAVYGAQAEAWASSVEAMAEAERGRFAALPAPSHVVVSYHQSFPYLYDWLGLKEIETVEPKPGIPPAPNRVAQVLSTMRTQQARVIVQESYQPTNVSQTLAGLAKGEVIVIAGGARVAKGQSYEAHMKEVADALYRALQGSGPAPAEAP